MAALTTGSLSAMSACPIWTRETERSTVAPPDSGVLVGVGTSVGVLVGSSVGVGEGVLVGRIGVAVGVFVGAGVDVGGVWSALQMTRLTSSTAIWL